VGRTQRPYLEHGEKKETKVGPFKQKQIEREDEEATIREKGAESYPPTFGGEESQQISGIWQEKLIWV